MNNGNVDKLKACHRAHVEPARPLGEEHQPACSGSVRRVGSGSSAGEEAGRGCRWETGARREGASSVAGVRMPGSDSLASTAQALPGCTLPCQCGGRDHENHP